MDGRVEAAPEGPANVESAPQAPPRDLTPLVAELRRIAGENWVYTAEHQLRTYESDGLLQYHATPAAAVLPATTEEVAAIVRACARDEVPWVARGAGSGLSGGALPVAEGVLIVLSRMKRILEIDLDNGRVCVEPGVTNAGVSAAVGPAFFYPPDPSSQIVCSIGGNVAENSGGAHCFKYGFTTNYVTGLELVLGDGEVVQIGGYELDPPGYDLLGAFVGSEGTLGVATKIWLRVVPAPETVRTLVAFFDVRVARDEAERQLFWKTRKAAFPAMGRISPNYFVQDGVIPRTKLPEVLERIDELAREYDMIVANVFHAGDGNLHPLVCYDGTVEGDAERAEELSGLIIDACLDAGGSITGEHGVGVDKKKHMPKMFDEPDLDAFQRLRCAFDPAGLANPGKLMPTPRLCGEVPGPYRRHPLEVAGLAERF
jgi:FAD/FMN-containing dehydrogenase